MDTPIGLTLYNPDLLSEADLVSGFVARQPLLAELFDDIRRIGPKRPPQHHLVLGQRGLGKTTLLRRLAFAIARDAKLSATWQPLVFPEEQYNVAGLRDFWLNCADALSDALERDGRHDAAEELDDRIEQLGPKPKEDAALALLLAEADRLDRRLVLLVDNIDLVVDRIGRDQEWPFRRLLSEENRLLLIGASSRALEAFYEHGRAFYDFFQVHELKGLDDDETFAVLRNLAERAQAKDVLRLLDEQPARLKTLRLLTGGNPRTLVLLFRIFQQGVSTDIGRDLEQLLDLYTPLYKARFEELPPQSQKVVDAMALHWDPLTAADLAKRTGFVINVASAQLKRLEDLGVVEKTPWFGKKKMGFQIAERFFNIWYLMRASRRVRRKLIWLVKFLEAWFSEEELRAKAEAHLKCDVAQFGLERYAELSFAYAQAIPGGLLRTSLEHAGLRAAMADDKIREYIDLSDLPPALLDKKERMEKMREMAEAVPHARADWGDIEPHQFWQLMAGSPYYEFAEKQRIAESLDGLPLDEVRKLHQQLAADFAQIAIWRNELDAVKLYEAIARGEVGDAFDWPSLVAVGGEVLAIFAIDALTFMRHAANDTVKRAETTFREMTSEPALAPRAWLALGQLYSYTQRNVEAQSAYRCAIDADPNNALPWTFFGVSLFASKKNGEAEAAFRRAIQLDPMSSVDWALLGIVLTPPRLAEAADELLQKVRADAISHEPLVSVLLDWIRILGRASSVRQSALALATQALDVFPASVDAACVRAEVLVRDDRWNDGREVFVDVIRRSGAAMGRVPTFCSAAIERGHLDELIQLFRQTDAADRWRPLFEALRAVEAGNIEYLQRVAPEIRTTAEQLYKSLTAPKTAD